MGYKDWGGDQWIARIIKGDFKNPGRFAQAVSIQFDTLGDLSLYPYWRKSAAPFVD